MRRFHTTATMPYAAEAMFALAGDIERYPLFVPLCWNAAVWGCKTDDGDRKRLMASLEVGYPRFGLCETFVNSVTLDHRKRHIHAFSDRGPVKHLATDWFFRDLTAGWCEIDFTIVYKMRSVALQLVVAMMFEKAFDKIITAFRVRADAVYGARALGNAASCGLEHDPIRRSEVGPRLCL